MSVNQTYNEKELLLRIAEGDEKAFGILFSHYYTQIYSLVHRFSLNDEDVREALQKAFLSVWLQRDQLTDVANFKAWLLRIASRKCRELLRKSLLHQRIDTGFAQISASFSQETPADSMQVSEVKQLVQVAIQKMPDQRRRIFQLSREDGLKPSEIADQLNLSVSTVKNTLVTALKQIREHLARAGYSFPIILSIFFYLD